MTAPNLDVKTAGHRQPFSSLSTPTTEPIVGETPAADKVPAKKRFQNLRARLCLRGHQLHELADGSYLVSRWNLTRDLSDLDAVERFAVQVGA